MSILKVDTPFHFGWKHESDGSGTIQHLDLDVWSHDVSIYKDKKIHATLMLWEPTVSEETHVSRPKSSNQIKKPTTEVFMFGPDAM